MATRPTDRSVISLCQLMLDDMAMRAMGLRTQHDYVRHVRAFAAFLRRSPDTATAKDVRRFQLDQREHNVGQSAINATVSALRFLFGVTLERPDLSRRLVLARRPSKLPDVLSVEEGAKLLAAAPGIKYRAARRVAYASWAARVGGRPPQGPAAPVSGPQKQLDRLRKTAVRRPRGGPRLSVALHPPSRDLEQSPDPLRRHRRHLTATKTIAAMVPIASR